jgi:hypothetical protein
MQRYALPASHDVRPDHCPKACGQTSAGKTAKLTPAAAGWYRNRSP